MVTDSLSQAGALALPALDTMQVVGIQVVSAWSAGNPAGQALVVARLGRESILPL